MSLTVSESAAVFTVLRWLSGRREFGTPIPTDRDVVAALTLLGERAGQRLQLSPGRVELARISERLTAADSDGAAQAVCEALGVHIAHGGSIPWPSIRRPFEEWAVMQPARSEP